MAIPIKFDHGSRRLQKDQLFEQSRHLTIGWSLKPDYGYSGQPCACRVTPYFAQHRVARPRSSNRGSYVSLELPETSLVAPAGPSPRRLLRANPLPQPRVPVFQVVTGRGGHGLSLIVLPRQTKKTAPARLLMVPTGLSRLDARPAKR